MNKMALKRTFPGSDCSYLLTAEAVRVICLGEREGLMHSRAMPGISTTGIPTSFVGKPEYTEREKIIRGYD